jgi:MFS transporter, OPA family, sugar phosphate sensor protein UhpC
MRARIFLISWLAYAGLYLGRKNFSVAMPRLQEEGGLDKFQLANLLFVYSLMYTLGQFVMGPLADRFGARKVVGAGLLLAAAANIGMGLAPWYGALFALGMLNGVGQSAGWPGLVKMMAAWFRPDERGVVMAWWTTNYVLGGFLATILAAWLLGNPVLGIENPLMRVFVLPPLLLAVIAGAFLLLARNRPPHAPAAVPGEGVPVMRAMGEALRRPVVWVTGATAFLLKVMRYSFLYWLPLYMVERMRYAEDEAGYASSVFELVGFAGALAAGYASDKLFGARRFPVACLMLLGLAAACLAQPSLAASGWWGNLAGIALIGIMLYGPDTLMQGAASQDAGTPESAATAAGLICGIASAGQLVSPYATALLATRYGWDALFQFFVLVSLAAAGLTALQWRYRAQVI